MTERLNVALIEDDLAVLDSTRLLLLNQGVSVLAYASAEAFLSGLARIQSTLSCIVCDVRLPGRSGLELHAELRAQGCRVPVVLITGHGHVAMAVAAIKAGAHDFIEKPFRPEQLLSAIRDAAAAFKADHAAGRERDQIAARAAQLSARQREVMGLVVEGYSSRQIAARLGISPRTVETYRLQIMEKMGAGSVAALVRMAAQITSP